MRAAVYRPHTGGQTLVVGATCPSASAQVASHRRGAVPRRPCARAGNAVAETMHGAPLQNAVWRGEQRDVRIDRLAPVLRHIPLRPGRAVRQGYGHRQFQKRGTRKTPHTWQRPSSRRGKYFNTPPSPSRSLQTRVPTVPRFPARPWISAMPAAVAGEARWVEDGPL